MTDAAEDTRLEERRAILAAMLPHVPFDGWSDRALRRAFEDADIDPAAARLIFPGGAADVIMFWSAEADRAAVDAYGAADGEAMKFRDRIAFLVRARLEAIGEHREAARRALTHLAQPQYGARGVTCLYRTVDEIWYAAGDRSTDFNFYTKRLTLAGVYSSTLLYWLDDASEDSVETWRFLDRRIAGVMRIPARRQKLQQVGRYVPNPKRFARLVSERLREGRVS